MEKLLFILLVSISSGVFASDRPNSFLATEENTITVETWEVEARELFDKMNVLAKSSNEKMDGYADGTRYMIRETKILNGNTCHRYTMLYPDGFMEPQGDKCILKVKIN